MSGESTALTVGRKVSNYVDINYPEPFICRPVSGSVPSGGSAQWSTPATTSGTASAIANLDFLTNWQGARQGLIDGVISGGCVEFGITVGIKTSQTSANGSLSLQARNNGESGFVTIDDGGISGGNKFAITTAEIEKTFAGYFPTTDGFNKVPFDLRIAGFSDNATALAIFRVKNTSYVKGIVWSKG